MKTAELPTVTPTSPPDLGYPPAKVSLARGAEIFGGPQGCQACHGISGKGDGQVASNFSCKLPNFTQADLSRSKTINAWFAITTNGNNGDTSCLMPAWKSRLDEQQRWDVASYIYSLHYTSDQLTQGQKIYQDKCLACHGERGAGDGPQASGKKLPNLADPAYLINKSDTDLWKAVTNGMPDGSHSFKDQLNDDQRWAVVAYTRSLTWDSVQLSATQEATQAATERADTPTVTISGKITNATPSGKAITAGMPLTLRVIDLSSGSPKDVDLIDGKTGEGGTFSFGEQPRRLNMVYVIAFSYGGVSQISTPIRLAPGAGPALDLSFKVYETTDDMSVIQVQDLLMFASPFSENTLLVRQGMTFLNTSDRLYVGSGQTSVAIALPANATQVKLDDSVKNQFTVDSNNVIRSTQPIFPGAKDVLALQVSYLLPYQGQPQLLIPTTYPINSLTIHTPQISGLVPADTSLIPNQPLQLDDGVYNSYTAQGTIPAGKSYIVTLKTAQDQSSEKRNTLAIVLFVASIVLTLTGLSVWWLNRRTVTTPTKTQTPADRIIRSIADLDRRFEQGKIGREEYEAERARLKADAVKVIE